jgi:hypothetical protein
MKFINKTVLYALYYYYLLSSTTFSSSTTTTMITTAFQLDAPWTVSFKSGGSNIQHARQRRRVAVDFKCRLFPSVTTSLISRLSSYKHPFGGSGIGLTEEEEHSGGQVHYNQNGNANNNNNNSNNKHTGMPETSKKGVYQIKSEEQYE